METGSQSHLQSGTYGTEDVADAANVPGVRYGPVLGTPDEANLYFGFGEYSFRRNEFWKYEAALAAAGDPHITSIWGCAFDADKNKTEAVLMKCETGELRVRYNEDWDYHIYQVVTIIDGKHDKYHHGALKHPQKKTICGNDIEFHRYYAGINLKVTNLRNFEIGGLFNDSRCVENWDMRQRRVPNADGDL